MAVTAHLYQIFVRATPEQVWQAITDPAFTTRYFHGTAFTSTLEPGSPVRYVMAAADGGGDAVDGTIEVADAPNRLVMTWRSLYRADMAAEPPSRVEWIVEAAGDGLTRVRVAHGDLAKSPATWAGVKDGWVWILDCMKSVLETGQPLPDWTADAAATGASAQDVAGEWHRAQGIEANNSTWEMIEAERTPANDEEMLRRAYAAAYHWQRAARRTPANEARALFLLARAHWKAGDAAAATRYADACLEAVQAAGDACADFDLAYAYEMQARAAALRGDEQTSLERWAAAKAVPIADPDDRAIIEADFADAPV